MNFPKSLQCQTCGTTVFPKWPELKTGPVYLGRSYCNHCRSTAVHVVGDHKDLEEYTKTVDLGNDVQVDLFGTDATGGALHERFDAFVDDKDKH